MQFSQDNIDIDDNGGHTRAGQSSGFQLKSSDLMEPAVMGGGGNNQFTLIPTNQIDGKMTLASADVIDGAAMKDGTQMYMADESRPAYVKDASMQPSQKRGTGKPKIRGPPPVVVSSNAISGEVIKIQNQ